MKLFPTLILGVALALTGLAAQEGAPPQAIDRAELEAVVIWRADQWQKDYQALAEKTKTTDPSAIAQKAYFESLKTDFTTVLETPPEQVSDDAITRAMHSSLRHYAGLSKELIPPPDTLPYTPGPMVFFWYLEAPNLQLRSSAAEQLCLWLVQNGETQGWATADSPLDGKIYSTKQILQRLNGAYSPYFTEAALADFMTFATRIAALDTAEAREACVVANRAFRAIAKESPDRVRAYLEKQPGVAPGAVQALLADPSLDKALALSAGRP